MIYLFAGVAFFLYGMNLASDYLQKLAANRVRQLMNSLQDRQFLGIAVGIALTILLQSSGAVTCMLVSLGSAGVINLTQVMGVIIGSAIGSTLTVQIISFNLAQWGLTVFLVAFSVFFITKQRILKNISGVFIGFGLIFYGLELMSSATAQFKEIPEFMQVLDSLKGQPILAILITSLITGFVHSSAVVIGFAMTLASSGLIGVHDAMYWIYGANIGTTATALLVAVGGNHIGRQVAWAHFFYKVGSVILFLFITQGFAEWMLSLDSNPSRALANSHTMFNVISAILYYPFIHQGVRLIEKFFPPREDEKEFSTQFIPQDTGVATTIAYAQSVRESLRMADIVNTMVYDSIKLFESKNPDLMDDLRSRDNKVDHLFREIKSFLVKQAGEGGEFNHQTLELLSFVTDIESAADIVDKNLIVLSEKKHTLQLEFSPQGWVELQQIHESVLDIIRVSLSAIQLHDKALAEEMLQKKRHLRVVERRFRESHLSRLNRGLKASINTSSIHLEILSDYRRIAGLFTNHAYGILAEEKPTQPSGSLRHKQGS
ncbi:MAG: Na/Pi cotransporter family protein [Bdellovibrionales bacterium]